MLRDQYYTNGVCSLVSLIMPKNPLGHSPVKSDVEWIVCGGIHSEWNNCRGY